MSRIFLAFGFIIFVSNCNTADMVIPTSKTLPLAPGAVISDATPFLEAKHQADIEPTRERRLDELSETERLEFVEETALYLNSRELIEIVKEDCYENKEIENSNNCLELRGQCVDTIRSNRDNYLNEFAQKLPEVKSCLNGQFSHSNLGTENIINAFNFFIDYLTTMHKELDCPSSFERAKQIYDKVVEHHGGEEAIEDLLMEDIDKLFYPCLHKYIFR